MYIDPTGHAFTKHDSDTIRTSTERNELLELSDYWEFNNLMMSGASNYGQQYAYYYAMAKEAHYKAEAIRDRYRGHSSEYIEYSSDDGLTTTVSRNGVVSKDYVIRRSRIYDLIKGPSFTNAHPQNYTMEDRVLSFPIYDYSKSAQKRFRKLADNYFNAGSPEARYSAMNGLIFLEKDLESSPVGEIGERWHNWYEDSDHKETFDNMLLMLSLCPSLRAIKAADEAIVAINMIGAEARGIESLGAKEAVNTLMLKEGASSNNLINMTGIDDGLMFERVRYHETPSAGVGNRKTVKVYHYTDKKGYNGISSQKPFLFKASSPIKGHPNGVYVTTKSPEELAKIPNGYKKLGLTNEKSSYYFEFEIDASELKPIKGDRGEFIKYIEDDFEISRDSVTSYGETPKGGK